MREDILCLVSIRLQKILKDISSDNLNELRLRNACPLILYISNKEYFIKNNQLTTIYDKYCVTVDRNDINESLEHITNCSLYAYEDEIKHGYITADKGHRVGICGRVIYDNNEIYTLRDIQAINIRVANQIKGCAARIIPYIKDENNLFMNTLIISPPGVGKTTLLRDIIRCISNGINGFEPANVGLVDERCEIASCLFGIPQNDVGIRTDVLDGCKKTQGILMLVRSMKPNVVAVDEIGAVKDSEAILYGAYCGCRILSTIHAFSIDDIRQKEGIRELIKEKIFRRYIVISIEKGIRNIKIFDQDFKNIY